MSKIFDSEIIGLLEKASIVEYASETVMYLGYTQGDVADSDEKWAICKVEDSTTDTTTFPRTKSIKWANGRRPANDRILQWSQRATYDYQY